MISIKPAALFLLATGSLPSLAVPTSENNNNTIELWAQLCEDRACSQECTMSADVANPGCLTESGKRSIRFHGGWKPDIALVLSSEKECPCSDSDEEGGSGSSYCVSVPHTIDCWDISRYSWAESFRFVEGNCGEDTQCED